MKKWAVLAVFLSFPSLAADDGEMTGGQFASGCNYDAVAREHREFLRTSCMSFLRGFLAYQAVIVAMVGKEARIYCIPAEGTTLESIRLAVLLGAQKHPEAPSAGSLVMTALAESFPCPAPGK